MKKSTLVITFEMFVYTCAILSIFRAFSNASFAKHITGIGEAQLESGYIDGDFIIGALFPVHEQPLLRNSSGSPLICGRIREQYGIQRVEAALFAIDSINNNTDLLPGITLGINIKDGCWSESVNLHQTLSLIEYPSLRFLNNSETGKHGKCFQSLQDFKPLIGVIGPASSADSILVQNILKLFQIPQIGYSATTPQLSNSVLYPYYMRVVPGDQFQNKLIVSLLKKFNWTYINVIYTDVMYGENAVTYFRENLDETICVANYKAVNSLSTNEDFDSVIKALNEDKKANVIVCYCEGITVTGLLSAIQRANLTGRFMFLGSDAWSTRMTIINGYEAQAKGSITVGIQEIHRTEFEDYFVQLNPEDNDRNPWFAEFWEYHFNCVFNPSDNTDLPICNGMENLRENFNEDSKVDYVIKSVYTMAHGLHDMRNNVCKNETGVCTALKNFNTSLFWNHLVTTNFNYYGDYVNFYSTGESRKVKYNIFNYQQTNDSQYEYIMIGTYHKNDDFEELIIFDNVTIQYPSTNKIKSVCSEPCPPGSVMISSKENKNKACCWSCVQCKPSEISVNRSTCMECFEGYLPNVHQTRCERTSLILFLFSFSCFGIITTLITAFIFINYQNTPVVKSSTRELCYLMLIGMIMAHSTVFFVFLLNEASFFTNVILRTWPTISFSIIYASLLVKTNRIARILAISKKKFPNLRPRFMSLTSQLIITFVLIMIQVIICIIGLIEEPPFEEKKQLVALGSLIHSVNVKSMLLPFIFVGFLVIMCTFYAVKTRNLPDNFNEAKFIGFSMYVTCITWIAFGLVYFGSRLKITILCICSSINALVILTFLFLPKLYIILFRPERNTRANYTTTKGIRCTIAVNKTLKMNTKQKITNSRPVLEKEFKNIIKLKKIEEDNSENSEQEKLTELHV